MDLDERKYKILQAIIDDYITTAMPVGSRTISRKQGMGLSSATIRNEIATWKSWGIWRRRIPRPGASLPTALIGCMSIRSCV